MSISSNEPMMVEEMNRAISVENGYHFKGTKQKVQVKDLQETGSSGGRNGDAFEQPTSETPMKIYPGNNRSNVKEIEYDPNWYFPVVALPTSIFVLLVNIFFPGIGTIIIACIAKDSKLHFVCMGISQLLTSWLIVGWVWAIVDSIVLITKAKKF